MMAKEELTIGIDAGGTKTELNFLRPDGEVVRIDGPGANLQRAGMEATAEVLFSLVARVAERHPGGRILSVCAGLAGAGRPDERRRLAAALEERFSTFEPAREAAVEIVHDGVIALEAAFPDGSGIISITGTGSIVYARTNDGRVERAGGWGYLLGDEGSGHAIGLQGVRAVLAAFEGGSATTLTRVFAEKHGIESIADAIRLVYREGWPVAKAARDVVAAAKSGDAVAGEIVREQAHLIARQVGWLANRLSDEIDHRVGLLGGLTASDYYRDALKGALAAALPGWDVHRVEQRPVAGALHLAEKMSRSAEVGKPDRN